MGTGGHGKVLACAPPLPSPPSLPVARCGGDEGGARAGTSLTCLPCFFSSWDWLGGPGLPGCVGAGCSHQGHRAPGRLVAVVVLMPNHQE